MTTRSGGAWTNIRDLLGVISVGVIKTVASPAALEIVKSVFESGLFDSPSTQILFSGEFSKSSLRILVYEFLECRATKWRRYVGPFLK